MVAIGDADLAGRLVLFLLLPPYRLLLTLGVMGNFLWHDLYYIWHRFVPYPTDILYDYDFFASRTKYHQVLFYFSLLLLGLHDV